MFAPLVAKPQANNFLRPPGGQSLSRSRQGLADPEHARSHHGCTGCDLGRVPIFPPRQTAAHRDGISPSQADGGFVLQRRLATSEVIIPAK